MSSVEPIALVPKRRGAAKIKLKRAPGRPTSFKQETADEICKRLGEGETLRSICRDKNMPVLFTVLKWLNKSPEFVAQYARARDAQADSWADKIVDIAYDSVETEARSRLKIDTLKWLMARMAPKKYGDRMTQDLTGNITFSLADLVNSSYQEPKLVEAKEIKDGDEKA